MKTVPFISSSTTGPLGAAHLPRLWLKLSLARDGQLADGYDECGAGFDQMTLDGLGLDKNATLAFIRNGRPTYVAFEAWVRQNGKKLDKPSIDAHNKAVLGYNHGSDLAAKMRKELGVTDNGVNDAVTLNILEDLAELAK